MTGQTSAVLAVDLGSAHTVAVARHPDGRTRPLLFDSSPLLPSAVYADPDAGLIVGQPARRAAVVAPDRFEPYPKRRIDDGEVLLGDRAYPIVDLFAAVLRRVAAEARLVLGVVPPAVLTHPAGWASTRRSVLVDAARNAGLSVAGLVAEPVAAAHHFTAVTGRRGPLAVFDFGAGTLDVAVVAPDGTLLAQGGLADLGGADLDAAAVRRLRPQAPEDTWARLDATSTDDDRRDRLALWEAVRTAKEMLSRSTTAPVPIPGRAAAHLTRDEFEAAVTPLVARAVEETARVIAAAGVRPDRLSGIYLVGGASRVPMVAAALHRALSAAPTILEQPELAVAEGALPDVPAAEAPPAPAAGAATPPSPAPGHSHTGGQISIADRSGPRERSHRLIAAAALVAAVIVATTVVLARPDILPGGGSPNASPDASHNGQPESQRSGTTTVLTRTLPGRHAESAKLKAFVAGWDSYDWISGQGCGVAAAPDRLDGQLGIPDAVAPAVTPLEAIHCRNGDFAAYFARYNPDDTRKVDRIYQRIGYVDEVTLPDGATAEFQRLDEWNGDTPALWWSDMDCECAGVITTTRNSVDLAELWARHQP